MLDDRLEIIRRCSTFLSGHGQKSVRELALAVAESPLALKRADHYGNLGFLSEFETEIAELLGKESAVYMPSGTMAQQIALRIWAEKSGSNKIAFHPLCHLELWEQNAYRELHHLESVLVGQPDRIIELNDLRSLPQGISTLLIELPQREIGGQLPSWESLVELCTAARESGLTLHLDGARLWECQPHFGHSLAEIAGLFDSVYVSFYKVLGALPGAMLAGPKDFVQESKIWLRRHGGNLHQQAIGSISAKLCLDARLPRIPDYVAKAKELVEVLREFAEVKIVPADPPTNMMHLYIEGDTMKLNEAALQIAKEDSVCLFTELSPTGKLELWTGDSALQLSQSEMKRLFEKLFRIAQS